MILNTTPLKLEFTPKPVSLLLEGRRLNPSVRLGSELALFAMDPHYELHADEQSYLYYRAMLYGHVDNEIPLYFMYRGLARPQDAALFESWKVRFDITVIPPARLGEEPVKTAGHYHREVEAGLAYPEILEVLVGEAHFLLQKPRDDALVDVVLVQGSTGDKLLVPPEYGHVTINPSPETLVMANLVSSTFKPLYDPYRARRGAAYYEFYDGRLVPNPRYGPLPPLRRAHARDQQNQLPQGNIYGMFLEDHASLQFLNQPRSLSAVRLALN